MAEFNWVGTLAAIDQFGVRFKQAENLFRIRQIFFSQNPTGRDFTAVLASGNKVLKLADPVLPVVSNPETFFLYKAVNFKKG